MPRSGDERRRVVLPDLTVNELCDSPRVYSYLSTDVVNPGNIALTAVRRPPEKARVAELAALNLVAFAGTQGFIDGNKRTGLAWALVFLGLNSVSFEAESKELLELTLRVATHQIGDKDAAKNGSNIRLRRGLCTSA